MKRTASTGERIHYITLWTPGTLVSDGDGGFTSTLVPLSPSYAYARIVASPGTLERTQAGAVVGSRTSEIAFPYHAGVTLETVIVLGSTRFAVVGVDNPERRNLETICTVVETEVPAALMVSPAPPSWMDSGWAED